MRKYLHYLSNLLIGFTLHKNKNILQKYAFGFLGLFLMSHFSSAQSITASVDPIVANEPVTFTADVTGNAALKALEEAWIWTWVSLPAEAEYSVPTNVNPATGAEDAAKWTKVSDGIWEITLTPTEFLNVNATDLKEIGVIFKGKDWGDGQTDNFLFDVIPSAGALQITLTQPTQAELDKASIGSVITFDFTTNKEADLNVWINGNSVLSETAKKALKGTWTVPADGGLFEIEMTATAIENEKEEKDKKTLSFFIAPSVVKEDRPEEATKLGANFHDGKVTLVLQDPAKLKKNVYAIGDFSDWKTSNDFLMKLDEESDANYWWITLSGLEAKKEYIYQYLMDGEVKIADPYTEKISDFDDKYINQGLERYPNLLPYPADKTSFRASVFQIEQESYTWEHTDFVKPNQEDLVVYEMHIRDFTEDDTYKAAMAKLDYIKELGANCIHLMPVNEFEGNDSWGYNPNFYFAPDKYYGTKNDLKKFIDTAHGMGIAVILDMVLNHSFHSAPMVRMYNDGSFGNGFGEPSKDNPWYNTTSPNTDYSWGADFNHESKYTQTFVDSVNIHWVKEYHIDGYRFDFTKGFTQTAGPGHDYDASRIAILKRMKDAFWAYPEAKGAYVILEHLADKVEEQELAAADMILWGNINHDFRETSKGGTKGLAWQFHEEREFPKMGLMSYMESHDEERLMYDALKYGATQGAYNLQDLPNALERQKLNATFFFTVPGPKLIWQFGELGYDYSINYEGRTGRKPVKWEYAKDPLRMELYKTYQALISLRNQLNISDYKAQGADDDVISLNDAIKTVSISTPVGQMYAIGNFNMSETAVQIDLPVADEWYNYFTGEKVDVADFTEKVNFRPSEFRVFVNKVLDFPEKGLLRPFHPMVTLNTYDFDENTALEIFFDASQGNAALAEEEKVFINAGLVFEGIGSEKREKETKVEMTKEGDKWKIALTPSEFFELTETEKPLYLIFHFEDETGDKKGLTLDEKHIILSFEENIEAARVVFSPSDWKANKEVSMTVYVGGTPLEGDVTPYLWAWITGSEAKGEWGNSSEDTKMERISETQVKITMTPTAYFDATSSSIEKGGINFLVKSKDGSVQTADFGPYKPTATPITGVEDELKKQAMYLAPNPASGAVEIGFTAPVTEPVTVDIFNTQGQLIFSGLFKTVEQKISLDISTLTGGIYIVRTVSNFGVQTKKLLVQ